MHGSKRELAPMGKPLLKMQFQRQFCSLFSVNALQKITATWLVGGYFLFCLPIFIVT